MLWIREFCFFSLESFFFCKSNRKRFSRVCISWYKHSRGWESLDSNANPPLRLGFAQLSRILPNLLVFVSGYANTENVFYCLNGERLGHARRREQGWGSGESTRLPPIWPRLNFGVDAICRLSSCSERFFSRYGFPLFLKNVVLNSNDPRNPIICKESIQLTMIKSRNQQNKKSPTRSLFFIEIRARLEAFVF